MRPNTHQLHAARRRCRIQDLHANGYSITEITKLLEVARDEVREAVNDLEYVRDQELRIVPVGRSAEEHRRICEAVFGVA